MSCQHLFSVYNNSGIECQRVSLLVLFFFFNLDNKYVAHLMSISDKQVVNSLCLTTTRQTRGLNDCSKIIKEVDSSFIVGI